MLSEYQSRIVPLLFAAIPTFPKCSLRDFHFALVPLWAPIEFWVNLEGAHPCHLTLLPRAAWGRQGCRASSGAGWPKGQLLLLLSSPPAGPSGCPYLPVPTALWALLYSPSPSARKIPVLCTSLLAGHGIRTKGGRPAAPLQGTVT